MLCCILPESCLQLSHHCLLRNWLSLIWSEGFTYTGSAKRATSIRKRSKWQSQTRAPLQKKSLQDEESEGCETVLNKLHRKSRNNWQSELPAETSSCHGKCSIESSCMVCLPESQHCEGQHKCRAMGLMEARSDGIHAAQSSESPLKGRGSLRQESGEAKSCAETTSETTRMIASKEDSLGKNLCPGQCQGYLEPGTHLQRRQKNENVQMHVSNNIKKLPPLIWNCPCVCIHQHQMLLSCSAMASYVWAIKHVMLNSWALCKDPMHNKDSSESKFDFFVNSMIWGDASWWFSASW